MSTSGRNEHNFEVDTYYYDLSVLIYNVFTLKIAHNCE